MKKSKLYFIFFVFLILFSSSCLAQVYNEVIGSEDSVDDIRKEAEDAKEKIDKAKEYTDKEKWEYLSQEWKKMLLQEGKPLYYLDNFFQKISFVFLVILGEPYEFSIILFFMFFLWLYFFLEISKIMRLFFSMNGVIPYGIGFATASLIGQTGSIRWGIEYFADLLAALTTLFFWLSLILIFFLLGGFAKFIGRVGEIYQRKLEEAEKEIEKRDRQFLHMFADAVKEGFGFK